MYYSTNQKSTDRQERKGVVKNKNGVAEAKVNIQKNIKCIYTQKFSWNCTANKAHDDWYLHPTANQLTDYRFQYLEINLLDQAYE